MNLQLVTTRYFISLQRLKSIVRPTSNDPRDAVRWYYEQLNLRLFKEAYAYLSPEYRKKYPFSQWVKGYQSMVSAKVEIDSMTIEGRIPVIINSIDRVDGKEVHRKFEGSWKAVLVASNPFYLRWELQDPRIIEVN